MKLKDKVALVTGGSGGFGRLISQKLSNAGAHVIVTDYKESGSKIANEIGGSFIQADISSLFGTQELAKSVISNYGRVDILVNNAGLQHIEKVEDFPDDEWSRLIQIMLIAPFQLTKAFVPDMKASGWGRIINISSIHGLVASPYKSAYNSAKHGLIGLTKTVALEVGQDGITVNAICPGYSNTPLTRAQVGDQARTRNISEKDVVEKVMLEPAAIKRLVEPDEVASMVLYLASDEARSITGTSVAIDAGWTAR